MFVCVCGGGLLDGVVGNGNDLFFFFVRTPKYSVLIMRWKRYHMKTGIRKVCNIEASVCFFLVIERKMGGVSFVSLHFFFFQVYFFFLFFEKRTIFLCNNMFCKDALE